MSLPQQAEVLLASRNARTCKHFRRDSEFTPRRILDPLALPVVRCMGSKSGFNSGHIGLNLQRFGRCIDVATLLHEQKSLDRLGFRDLCVDSVFLRSKRFGGLLASRTRSMCFERFQVIADSGSFDTPRSNSRFVFISHFSFGHSACISPRHMYSTNENRIAHAASE